MASSFSKHTYQTCARPWAFCKHAYQTPALPTVRLNSRHCSVDFHIAERKNKAMEDELDTLLSQLDPQELSLHFDLYNDPTYSCDRSHASVSGRQPLTSPSPLRTQAGIVFIRWRQTARSRKPGRKLFLRIPTRTPAGLWMFGNNGVLTTAKCALLSPSGRLISW